MVVFKVAELNVVVVLIDGMGTGTVGTVNPCPLRTLIHISLNLGVTPVVDVVLAATPPGKLPGSTAKIPGAYVWSGGLRWIRSTANPQTPFVVLPGCMHPMSCSGSMTS